MCSGAAAHVKNVLSSPYLYADLRVLVPGAHPRTRDRAGAVEQVPGGRAAEGRRVPPLGEPEDPAADCLRERLRVVGVTLFELSANFST